MAPRFSIAAILLPRKSISYWFTQFMYWGLRRMSSGVSRPIRRGPSWALATEGSTMVVLMGAGGPHRRHTATTSSKGWLMLRTGAAERLQIRLMLTASKWGP